MRHLIQQTKAYAKTDYEAFSHKRRKMIEAEAERVTIEALEEKEKGGKE